jgi:hypothetical protein
VVKRAPFPEKTIRYKADPPVPPTALFEITLRELPVGILAISFPVAVKRRIMEYSRVDALMCLPAALMETVGARFFRTAAGEAATEFIFR